MPNLDLLAAEPLDRPKAATLGRTRGIHKGRGRMISWTSSRMHRQKRIVSGT